jgi:hypothetical protein
MQASVQEDSIRSQIDRVLSSNTFRACGSLRRLLEYLVDCAIAGDTQDLKEYRIGVEGLGKEASYDPRVDPSVRVQVGRLRARLAEYYLTEGKDDPVVITVPRGAFAVCFEPNKSVIQPAPLVSEPAATAVPQSTRRVPSTLTAVVASASVCIVILAIFVLYRDRSPSSAAEVVDNVAFRQLWRPYLSSDKPVMISLGVPLGLRIQTHTPEGETLVGHMRDGRINEWPARPGSDEAKRLEIWKRQMSAPEIQASYQYVAVGEAIAAISLGKALATKTDPIVIRSNMLSWDAANGANVIFVGAPKFNQHTRNVPFHRYFRIGDAHVHNLQPAAGEKNAWPDEPNPTDARGAALIGRYRSPGGASWFTLVGSANSMCTWAAVEYLTRPEYVSRFTAALEKQFGKVPDSFEAVIEATFDQSSPVEVHHVALREIKE